MHPKNLFKRTIGALQRRRSKNEVETGDISSMRDALDKRREGRSSKKVKEETDISSKLTAKEVVILPDSNVIIRRDYESVFFGFEVGVGASRTGSNLNEYLEVVKDIFSDPNREIHILSKPVPQRPDQLYDNKKEFLEQFTKRLDNKNPIQRYYALGELKLSTFDQMLWRVAPNILSKLEREEFTPYFTVRGHTVEPIPAEDLAEIVKNKGESTPPVQYPDELLNPDQQSEQSTQKPHQG